MIFLLFGPPGCGKGTQAVFLADRLHIPSISTGEMFRAEHNAGTEIGKAACKLLAEGKLVSDDLVNAMVVSRTRREDCINGFLLDGYPRTVPQAIFLSQLARERGWPEPVVIHLDVSDDLLVTRLTARRQCPTCHRIYNLVSQPSRIEGLCDDDGAALITRDDDREEVIRRRLRAYDELTGPVLKWYGPKSVITVDGSGSAADVSDAVARGAGLLACESR
jgi:adenylate kinase